MRYIQINAYGNAWAESIIFKKHRELLDAGHESWVFWARADHEQDERMIKIASYPEVCIDALMTRIDGRAGFHSKGITRRLLRRLDEIDPDVVHLHVLCGYWLNVEMLFNWLASHRCRVVWTLHDCWAFTGHCIYFTYVTCMQWRSGCAASASCPQRREYPETYFGGDASVRWCYENKRRLFTMLPPERMSLITPSKWLADLVKQSFLAKYEVKVVHNTVDTSVFKPTPSDFRKRYGLENRFVVLGVANKWSERKGLQDFIRLAGDLDSDRFCVVLVGLSEKQIEQVGKSLLALPRTDSRQKLAEIYTAADVLVNPSSEETFGMNVAEASACGTRSIVAASSACVEAAPDVVDIPADMSTLTATIVKLSGGGVAVLMQRPGVVRQLAAKNTAADVLFNPTKEENYPTVNLESEACHTPVVSYDTGGCSETLSLHDSAVVNSYSTCLERILEMAIE